MLDVNSLRNLNSPEFEVEQSLQAEINKFIALKIHKTDVVRKNPLKFWRKNKQQFPNLARLASRRLCEMASTSFPERTFSKSGIIMSKLRNRIKDPSVVYTPVFGVKEQNKTVCSCSRAWTYGPVDTWVLKPETTEHFILLQSKNDETRKTVLKEIKQQQQQQQQQQQNNEVVELEDDDADDDLIDEVVRIMHIAEDCSDSEEDGDDDGEEEGGDDGNQSEEVIEESTDDEFHEDYKN